MSRWLANRPLFLLAGLVILGLPWLVHSQTSDNRALVRVRIPSSAVLTIDAYATKQTGADRLFITPPLPADRDFSYTLQANWMENGAPLSRSVKIIVRAGQTTLVDFYNVATAQEPKKEEPKKVETTKKEEPKKTEPKKEVTKVEPKKVPPTKDPTTAAQPKSRKFQFTYVGVVKDLPPGKEAEVWVPVAVSSDVQEVAIVSKELPTLGVIARDPVYGNAMLHFKAKADANGQIPFQVTYKVIRNEVRTSPMDKRTLVAHEDQKLIDRFLQPDAKVPIEGKPLELIGGKKLPGDPVDAAKMFYDVVNSHMTYSKKGTGWGQGDAVWACESGYGNCSDFHSLFISMARSHKIPSKFEIGFPLPETRGAGPIGGYHCWAWFMPAPKSWIPVDISEANQHPSLKDYYFGNLTENRVTFTTGRDIDLVPRQKGPALNFFIYPYVEVDGMSYPREKIETAFDYADLP